MSQSEQALSPASDSSAQDADQSLTVTDADSASKSDAAEDGKGEYGGPKGLEPTRYGDWEKSGRCIDF